MTYLTDLAFVLVAGLLGAGAIVALARGVNYATT
jgi:hypothetical protein